MTSVPEVKQNENFLNSTIPQQPDYRRRRPTWNRNNREIEFENHNNSARTEPINNTLPFSNRNTSQLSANNTTASRSIFGPNPFTINTNNNNTNAGQDSQRGNRNTNSNSDNSSFRSVNNNNNNNNNNNLGDQETLHNNRNTNVTSNENQRNQSNPPVRPRSRPIFGGGGGGGGVVVTARSADNPTSSRRQQSPYPSPANSSRRPIPVAPQQSPGNVQRQRPPLGRSDTFEIDNPSNNLVPPRIRPSQTINDNSGNTELYNVRRRPRARTPVTFAVMLDEPESNIRFDVPTNNSILSESMLNNPVVDYASKKKS
jgi:hypothetical protein